jgi:hypothetical protein
MATAKFLKNQKLKTGEIKELHKKKKYKKRKKRKLREKSRKRKKGAEIKLNDWE